MNIVEILGQGVFCALSRIERVLVLRQVTSVDQPGRWVSPREFRRKRRFLARLITRASCQKLRLFGPPGRPYAAPAPASPGASCCLPPPCWVPPVHGGGLFSGTRFHHVRIAAARS